MPVTPALAGNLPGPPEPLRDRSDSRHQRTALGNPATQQRGPRPLPPRSEALAQRPPGGKRALGLVGKEAMPAVPPPSGARPGWPGPGVVVVTRQGEGAAGGAGRAALGAPRAGRGRAEALQSLRSGWRCRVPPIPAPSLHFFSSSCTPHRLPSSAVAPGHEREPPPALKEKERGGRSVCPRGSARDAGSSTEPAMPRAASAALPALLLLLLGGPAAARCPASCRCAGHLVACSRLEPSRLPERLPRGAVQL